MSIEPRPRDPSIENEFTHHPPFGTQLERYQALREKGKELAYLIDAHCPEAWERGIALVKLREAIMWANAAIACNESPRPEDKTPEWVK